MRWKKTWKLRKKSGSSLWVKSKKNNELLTLPTTPSPKLFGNTHLFEQKSETTAILSLSDVVTVTADSSQVKPFEPEAKSVMDARVAEERAEKKARLQKQLSENTEKMNVIKIIWLIINCN